MKKIKLWAAHRLAVEARSNVTDVNSDAASLIKQVETVMKRHQIKRALQPYPNPREYRKIAPEELLVVVQRELERMGFKFKKLPVHSMDTKAVESEGSFQSVDYILDLVFRYDQLEVDLYY